MTSSSLVKAARQHSIMPRPRLRRLSLLFVLLLHLLLFQDKSSNFSPFNYLNLYGGESSPIISFNVILTTIGSRPSLLRRQLASLGPQLTSHDFITLLSDADPSSIDIINITNMTLQNAECNGCVKIFRQNARPMGGYGHTSRTFHQKSLPGAFHLHGDDDDLYTPDAFEIIRAVVTTLEERVYMFRAVKENYYHAKNRKELIAFPTLYRNPEKAESVGMDNGGTPCGVVRNIPHLLPVWEPRIGGDSIFWKYAIGNFSGPKNTVMVPRVIYMVNEDLYHRIHELGIDQPSGFYHIDKDNGRVLPNGLLECAAPFLNGKAIDSPNPLHSLKDRYKEAGIVPRDVTGDGGMIFYNEDQAQLLMGTPHTVDNFGIVTSKEKS